MTDVKQLPEAFLKEMEQLLGDEYEAYIDRFTLWQYLLDLRNMVQHNKYHFTVSLSTNK